MFVHLFACFYPGCLDAYLCLLGFYLFIRATLIYSFLFACIIFINRLLTNLLITHIFTLFVYLGLIITFNFSFYLFNCNYLLFLCSDLIYLTKGYFQYFYVIYLFIYILVIYFN